MDYQQFFYEANFFLEQAAKLLKPGIMLSLVIRDPENPTTHIFVFGNDDWLKDALAPEEE